MSAPETPLNNTIGTDFLYSLRVITKNVFLDENGDIDMTLIPADIKAWYVDTSDEEETVSECESDVESSWNMLWSSFVYKGAETIYVWLYFV